MFYEHKNYGANKYSTKLVAVSFVVVFPLLACAGPEGDSVSFGGGGGGSFGGGDYRSSTSTMIPVDQTMRNDEESLLKRKFRYRALKSEVKQVKNPKIITLNEGLAYRRPVRISMAMEK